MANYTMHHLNVGSNTYEMVDEQGRANIAPSFSTSTAYAAGDYVIYGGKLYQFTSAHSGAWTEADAEECTVAEDISQLKEEISQLSGLSEEVKVALLQIAQKVAYVDEHGQDYYDDLYDALYPPADLVSISAVYTQSGTVYDTDTLDSLRNDLVVTATYSTGTSAVVTGYTLSGTLTAGTSTITAAFGGQTAAFSVTVSHQTQVVKTYFSDVPTLRSGYLKKTNGAEQALSGGSYVELDYVDGMYIHSRMNANWSAYLNIVLYNGSSYSSVQMTKTGTEAYPTYENTLSGYTGITKVYVNCVTMNINDCYYEAEV